MWTSFQRYRFYSPKGLARLPTAKGFTLVELLVVVAVIALVTAFVLFNQGKFSSSTLLRSLGYSVALSMRQAQVFGVTVRGTTSSGASSFAPGYGTYVSTGDLTHFYLFADANGNGQLDTTPVDERLSGAGASALVFGRGYSISKFCGIINSSAQDCYPDGTAIGGPALTWITIYFKRPNPDACIATSAQPGACAPGGTPIYTGAYIQVSQAGSSDVRTVKVTNTGQIVVCQLGANAITC